MMSFHHRKLDALDWADRNSGYIVALVLVALIAVGAIVIGSVTPTVRGDIMVGAQPIHIQQSTATTRPVTVVTSPVLAVEVDTPAVRGDQIQVTPTDPPPTSSTLAVGVPGDCDSWRPVFAQAGGTSSEVDFFVPRIIRRETGCGRDMLNDSTGDSGICQINPIHNRAGYFGGRYYGSGGWLEALHGLRTWQNLHDPEWPAACLTLYRVCGARPWSPPYGCDHRPLKENS